MSQDLSTGIGSSFVVDDNIDMESMQSMTSQTHPIISASNATKISASDAFDGSAEPIVYMSDNRMPVVVALDDVIVYIIFTALLLALLSILPGVRRARLASFIGILSMIGIGASILLALDGTNWMTGAVVINDMPYSALTSETISGRLEVNIGLSATNVTLSGRLMGHLSSAQVNGSSKQVYYNERFHWNEPNRLALEHENALRKGLPYPILTVTEFLSLDSDGFNWMRQLRYAGRNTTLVLYVALASWCLTAVVMCLLPVYLAHMMQITGAIMMSSVWIYTLIIESPKSFSIHINAHQVEFAFGDTYMLTFVAGAMSMFAGIILFLMQLSSWSDGSPQVTIMDSEAYVNDQKAMQTWRQSSFRWLFLSDHLRPGGGGGGSRKEQTDDAMSDQSASCSDSDSVLKGASILSSGSSSTANSVIIPIADIEEKFKRES